MNPARAIGIGRMFIVALAVFLAIYELPDVGSSLQIIALLMVGVVGVLSFISHVPFHRADAERLGWKVDNPNFQYEVGFANLAFGVAALIVVAGNWSIDALVIITIGYAIYLAQAAVLHAYRYRTEEGRPSGYFVRSSLLTLVYVVVMLAFAAMAMNEHGIWPL